MTIQPKTALVLGATGGIGGEVARQLRDSGWQVRALRRGSADEVEDGITWIQGDALNRADVAAAAESCSVLIHAVNPPGYKGWGERVLPMLDNTVAVAAQSGATVVLPGTLYNYGPDAFPLLTETAPQHPLTRKGAIRVEMEKRLRDYADNGGRALIVRAGDFFGNRIGNNWFAEVMVAPGRPVTRIRNPGRVGVGHQWAYLPDVARAMVLLLEQGDQLEAFSCFHLGGHWDEDGTLMANAIRRVVASRSGRQPRISRFPWWLMRWVVPFNETLREVWEMRYLWRQPVRLDNTKITAALGREPHTPLHQAIEETLTGLKCLP